MPRFYVPSYLPYAYPQVIGWERRQADRPAGIRTMALVSLGSCLFSICSAYAFWDGPMAWDASRVSAAIPSGVGFLGSALIFKSNDEGTHAVHGLTTAASVWLSAAVGIACAGGLYFVSSFGTAIMLLMLRFGPRFNDDDDEDEDDDERVMGSGSALYSSIAIAEAEHETKPLTSHNSRASLRSSVRQRPQLL